MKKEKPRIPNVFIVRLITRFTNFLKDLTFKLSPPQALVFDLTVENIAVQRCLWVAADLGIADILKHGPKSIGELAKETNRHENSLYRVMRLLASFGIFKERKGKIFEKTAFSRHLEIDFKQSMLDMVRWVGSESNFGCWTDIMNSIKNGKSYYRNNFNIDYFTWIKDKPMEQIAFNDLLIEMSTLSSDPITAVYKFKHFHTLVDIGAGMGGQMVSILKANPKLKGIIFELPLTVAMLKNDGIFENAGISDRIELVPGNFFESVPAGYDAYFMKNILHDWHDEDCVRILTNCRKAMRKDSKLLIAETVIPEKNSRHAANTFHVLMLVFNEGCERTREEYTKLFKEAGLKLNRQYLTVSPFTILEAVPI